MANLLSVYVPEDDELVPVDGFLDYTGEGLKSEPRVARLLVVVGQADACVDDPQRPSVASTFETTPVEPESNDHLVPMNGPPMIEVLSTTYRQSRFRSFSKIDDCHFSTTDSVTKLLDDLTPTLFDRFLGLFSPTPLFFLSTPSSRFVPLPQLEAKSCIKSRSYPRHRLHRSLVVEVRLKNRLFRTQRKLQARVDERTVRPSSTGQNPYKPIKTRLDQKDGLRPGNELRRIEFYPDIVRQETVSDQVAPDFIPQGARRLCGLRPECLAAVSVEAMPTDFVGQVPLDSPGAVEGLKRPTTDPGSHHGLPFCL
jgi:hypothetical protein